MSKRRAPAPGLTYVDANPGRLVTFHQDVLGYKQVIESRWPELSCIWDNESNEWAIIETDKQGSQSLVFATEALGEHTIDRLGKAQNCNTDAFEEIESWNIRMEVAQEKRNAEMLGEVGEKLAWAIRKDEFNGPCPRIAFPKEIPHAGINS